MRAVERLKSGRYKVRFRLDGKQTSESFDRHKDAETFAKWLDALGEQGALDKLYEGEQDATVPTLNKVAGDHIEHLTGIEDGTRKTYTRLWGRTWGPLIGDLRADQVGPDQVRQAVNSLGERYSAKSLANQRGLLAAVLDRAVEKGYLTKNPSKRVRLPRAKETERAEMRILTPEEFAVVLDRVPEHYQGFVQFLVGTGCRWGEAVALRVEDWQTPNVRIRRALKWSPDNQRQIGPTKTKRSNRTLAVGATLTTVLDAACKDRAKGDLIFTAPKGGAILHRTFWSRVWLPAVGPVPCVAHEAVERDCADCRPGLDPRPRIHDLRHTHASWLLAAGVPIHVVQVRLGHESIKTTVDTYTHLMPDAQAAAASAAELAFRKLALE